MTSPTGQVAGVAVLCLVLAGCASRQPTAKPPQVDRARIDATFDELDGKSPGAAATRPAPPSAADPAVASGPRPGWTRQRPVDSTYYHGIGSSPSSSREARDRALGDLATEIEARVTSVVESFVEETGVAGREAEAELIRNDKWMVRVHAERTIQNPEWVGHWGGGGEYWSYARIPKQQVVDELQHELEEALRLAVDHLASGQRADGNDDVVTAAREYVRGLNALRQFLGRPLEAQVGGRTVLLNNELRRGADRALEQIEVRPESERARLVSVDRGDAADLVVSVRLGGRPLPGVPVRFAFAAEATGRLTGSARSDARGVARGRLSLIETGGSHVIVARIDLAGLAFGEAEVDPALQAYLDEVAGQTVEFQIGAVSDRMYIDVSETNLGQAESDPYFVRIAKSRLATEGAVEFAPSRGEADLVLQGTASTRFSSQMGRIVFCYADVSVRLVDRSTGRELYATKQTDVKGADKSEVDASHRAMEKAADEVVTDLLGYIRSGVGR